MKVEIVPPHPGPATTPFAERIPLSRTYLTGREESYIGEVLRSRKLSGGGPFTERCSRFFEARYGMLRALLTSSCTDALEMCALLADIGPGDEVIMPSYTFVSTANAFMLRGATLRFADSLALSPNISPASIAALITPKTKAVVVVHYAGISCDMDAILQLCRKHGIMLIEDAAHAVESFHRGRALGTIGDLGAYSFHDTKNITCGEGGLLAINNRKLISRAEILWEKGTNRVAFGRREVSKYSWVDLGSSFLGSEIAAATLWAQLEQIAHIQERRVRIWDRYAEGLGHLAGSVQLPFVPNYATANGHIFALVCKSLEERNALISHLNERGISAVFHYIPLHSSPFFAPRHDGRALPEVDRYGTGLVRLPIFPELALDQVDQITAAVNEFFGASRHLHAVHQSGSHATHPAPPRKRHLVQV